jgi:large subunit ribosomal protein L35Ae
MKGLIMNFRGGKHTKYDNQMIVDFGVKAKESIDKKVIWKSPAGKEIKGKVCGLHGRKGCVRVIFEKGMPGQAIGDSVEVN